MFHSLGVLNSDVLNRDGYVVFFQALKKRVSANAGNGLLQLIDHDFHRPLRWIIPFSLLIEPIINRAIGKFYTID